MKTFNTFSIAALLLAVVVGSAPTANAKGVTAVGAAKGHSTKSCVRHCSRKTAKTQTKSVLSLKSAKPAAKAK